jgi:hypothetical protein
MRIEGDPVLSESYACGTEDRRLPDKALAPR